MKLPTFQPQQGTSMASAMTTPAQVGQPKMRTAEIRPYTAVRNVQGELNVGLQKSKLALQIGESVVNTIALVDKIDSTNQGLAEKAASGEATNRMAVWLVDAKSNSIDRDDDGEYGYDTLEARYAEEAKRVEASVRDKYRFTRKDAEISFRTSMSGTYATHNKDILTHQNKRRTDNINYNYQVAKNSVHDIGNMTALADFAFKEGAITAKQAQDDVQSFKQDQAYGASVQTLSSMRLAVKAGTMSEDNFENNSTALTVLWADPNSDMTPAQRLKMINELDDMEEIYADVKAETQDENFAQFSTLWLTGTGPDGRTVLRKDTTAMVVQMGPEAFGDNYVPMTKLMLAEKEAGPQSRVSVRTIGADTVEYSMGRGGHTFTSLLKRITSSDGGQGIMNSQLSALRSAAQDNQNDAMKDMSDAAAFSMTGINDMNSLETAVEKGVVDKDKYLAANRLEKTMQKWIRDNPDMPWEQEMNRIILKDAPRPVVMLTSSGASTSDPKQMSLTATQDHISHVSREYQAWRKTNDGQKYTGKVSRNTESDEYSNAIISWGKYAEEVGLPSPILFNNLMPDVNALQQYGPAAERLDNILRNMADE